MTPIRSTLLTSALATAFCGAVVAQTAAPGASGVTNMVALQMPALPDPVAVMLRSTTTALLIFDVVDPICKDQPRCMGTMVPAITAFLERARKAGMVIGYSTRAPTMSNWLPQVAPAAGRPECSLVGAIRTPLLAFVDVMAEPDHFLRD